MTMENKVSPQNDLKYIGMMEMVMMRNYFYYNTFRKMMIVFIMLIAIAIALGFFLSYEMKAIHPPRYIATSIEGHPLALIPLNQANMKDNEIKTWAMEAAVEAYNMNFVNYRDSIQKARIYFTPKGYEHYLKALSDSRNLEAVKRKKMIVHAQINGQPQILKDSRSDPSLTPDGIFAWQVQIPVIVTFENSVPEKIVQSNILTILITRMNPLESPASIGIDSFVVQGV